MSTRGTITAAPQRTVTKPGLSTGYPRFGGRLTTPQDFSLATPGCRPQQCRHSPQPNRYWMDTMFDHDRSSAPASAPALCHSARTAVRRRPLRPARASPHYGISTLSLLPWSARRRVGRASAAPAEPRRLQGGRRRPGPPLRGIAVRLPWTAAKLEPPVAGQPSRAAGPVTTPRSLKPWAAGD